MTVGGDGKTVYPDKQLITAWNAGMTLTQISEAVGISRGRLRDRIRALGILPEDVNKRRYTSSAANKGKPVYQYGLDGYFIMEYPSLTLAEKKYDCTSIGAAVLGVTNTSCGYQWRPYKVDRIQPYYNDNDGQSKRVYQYSLDGRFIASFPSAADAARSIGKGVSNLCNVCKGVQRSCGGFLWSYDYFEHIEPVRKKKTSAKTVGKYTADGIFICSYNSLTEASRDTGVCKSSISSACKDRAKTAGGFKWMFQD